jgi:transcription termination/antitermination protein NusA
VTALFGKHVPEIANGIVGIKAVARYPGVRTKIAVASLDRNTDGVHACVGVDACRTDAITAALHHEPIDILPWADDRSMLSVQR